MLTLHKLEITLFPKLENINAIALIKNLATLSFFCVIFTKINRLAILDYSFIGSSF